MVSELLFDQHKVFMFFPIEIYSIKRQRYCRKREREKVKKMKKMKIIVKHRSDLFDASIQSVQRWTTQFKS